MSHGDDNPNRLSAYLIDERDAPQPAPGSDPNDYQLDPALDPANVVRALEPADLLRSLPVVPGAGLILDSGTMTLTVANDLRAGRRIGLNASRVQAQQRVAYLLVYVSGACQMAEDGSALAGQRFTFPNALGLALNHLIGAHFWPTAADVTVTWLVVGVHA